MTAARDLRRLARSYGIHLSYRDVATGARVRATTEALLAALAALDPRIASPRDAAAALRDREERAGRRRLEPVVVAWSGEDAAFDLRLPPALAARLARCRLERESGDATEWTVAPARAARRSAPREAAIPVRVRIPGEVPAGYHRLRVDVGPESHDALLVAAPARAHASPHADGRLWGVFAPLHALRSEADWGAGRFPDLAELLDLVRDAGGDLVTTLPLLAAFLDEPCEPSPYAPVSRLFWNEFFLDVPRIPDFARCDPARRIAESAGFRRALGRLRAADLVDYREGMRLKRRVLEEMAAAFFDAGPPGERDEFRRFLAEQPHVADYAAFRAAAERRREAWRSWPARARDGLLGDDDSDARGRLYHVYVQWRAEQQVREVAARARAGGPGLYLDFPLGVHPDGYDAWRHRDLFAFGVAGGAPPDHYSRLGQDWGSPPLHPERIREDRYRYVIACLRHHFRHAGILRIDHVMSLHRLFWVPAGMGASRGVYVRYRAEELYAILALESVRSGTILVGEDLGTVPREVRPAMRRRGFLRTWVLQRALSQVPRRAFSPPEECVAAMNTHDHPPFAAFWRGRDIAERARLGMIGASDARRERRRRALVRRRLVRTLAGPDARSRSPATRTLLRAALERLAAGASRVVVVNLEDLWGETRPVNVPGTTTERPNWRRRIRADLASIRARPAVMDALRAVARARRKEESHAI